MWWLVTDTSLRIARNQTSPVWASSPLKCTEPGASRITNRRPVGLGWAWSRGRVTVVEEEPECRHMRLGLGSAHRDHHTCRAGPGRASGAVKVGLLLGGWVDVDDQADAVGVDSPGSDVRRDQDLDLALGEGGEVTLTGALGEVDEQLLTRTSTAASSVAEKNVRWPPRGVRSTMRTRTSPYGAGMSAPLLM